MADKKLDFIVIPNKVMYCKSLTANAKLLMGVIIDLCNGTGNCWASNQYLSEIFGVGRMTISVWVNSLEKNGFIKCKIKENYKRKIFIDPHIEKTLTLYRKFYMDYIKNSIHIHTQQEQLSEAALANDDFDVEEKEWTDEAGKKHKRVSIDYRDETKAQ